LLTQGVADVLWPNGQRLPIGANVLLVAPSGSGKSMIFKLLMEAITRFLNRVDINADLLSRPALFLEDATRAAVIEHLRDWPVAGLFSDEGGQLNQMLRSAAPTLAKLLDGSPLRHARVSTGRIELVNCRLMMLLTEQPHVFEASKVLLGASTGGVGLINRFIVASATAMPTGSSLHRVGLSEPVRRRYELRIEDLLARTIQQVKSKAERPALQLSPETQNFFIPLADEIRQKLGTHASYRTISEYASRHSERVLKLAGSIHVFEHGPEGEVELATVKTADMLDRWSMDNFRRMTYQPPKVSQAEQDALNLEQALAQAVHSTGRTAFPLSQVRRSAPNMGLTKARLDRAVPILAGQGKVTVMLVGSVDWLQFNPPSDRLFGYGARC
jgi:hypothetical protein